jgi:hypothetical protein
MWTDVTSTRFLSLSFKTEIIVENILELSHRMGVSNKEYSDMFRNVSHKLH